MMLELSRADLSATRAVVWATSAAAAAMVMVMAALIWTPSTTSSSGDAYRRTDAA